LTESVRHTVARFSTGASDTMKQTALDQISVKGKFERKESQFRNFVGKEESNKFQPERNRYHLYISRACPWANRTHQFVNLKGLQDVIQIHSVHPTWRRTRPEEDSHSGWHFVGEGEEEYVDDFGRSHSTQGCTPDRLNGCKTVRELYDLAAGGTWDKSAFTTPVLWCSKEKTIVNNESSEICRMLNNSFNEFAKNKHVDLYPDRLSEKIAELEGWVYHDINNGVYKCGFASSQEAYDEAVGTLFGALDRVEAVLDKSRYLAGDQITGIDVWLFNTLIRFDAVYVVYFKTCKKCLREYHNILNYLKDLYQVPEIGETVDFWNIRTHYFTSHPKLNPHGIVPPMPDVDYNSQHDRATRKYN